MMPLALLFLLSFSSTSDHQDLHLLNLTAHPLSDINWNFANEAPSMSGWTADLLGAELQSSPLDYERYQARAGYFWKLDNKWTFEVWGGIHQFNQSRAIEKDHSDPVGEVALQRKTEAALYDLKVQTHYALDRLSPITGDLENLHSFSVKPAVSYLFSPDWKANYRGHYDWLKDANTHSISDVQVLRALSRDNLWLWVGLGSEYTTNSQRSRQYWSPPAAYSYGLRYDFAYGLTQKWTVLSGGSLHALHEEKNGTGHYFSSMLQYGERDAWQARLSFESVNSLQGANHWSSETFMVYFSAALK